MVFEMSGASSPVKVSTIATWVLPSLFGVNVKTRVPVNSPNGITKPHHSPPWLELGHLDGKRAIGTDLREDLDALSQRDRAFHFCHSAVPPRVISRRDERRPDAVWGRGNRDRR